MAAAFRPNPGKQPEETLGKRVVVKLANGTVQGDKPVNNDSKLGWAADTSRWSLTGMAFDIAEYRVL